MKAVYMILSGLILSIMATLAMAGLISVSELVRPHANEIKPKSTVLAKEICITKQGYAQHKLSDDGCNYPATH
jgi:hypothetical protein